MWSRITGNGAFPPESPKAHLTSICNPFLASLPSYNLYTHRLCLQRSKESIGLLGTGVTDS
ncbi:hypothetical protein STEG23_015295, partial [Scotinomys teguina]